MYETIPNTQSVSLVKISWESKSCSY